MRYIGSKRFLADGIVQAVRECGVNGGIVADLFAGTGMVARAFKNAGFRVIAADLLTFPYILQRAYVQLNEYPAFGRLLPMLDAQPTNLQPALFDHEGADADYCRVLNILNSLPGCEGYISREYAASVDEKDTKARRYFTRPNAMRMDAVRNQIELWRRDGLLSDDEYYLLLATFMEALPRVANICGTFGAYKKGEWDTRAAKPFVLAPIRLIKSAQVNLAMQGDANTLIRSLTCDVCYFDPPYAPRQYALYYHVLETIAEGKEPELRGLTGRPALDPNKMSQYCTAEGARKQLEDLVRNAHCSHIFLSYSSDGLLPEEQILTALALRGEPSAPVTLNHRHPRYRSDRDRSREDKPPWPRKYKDHKTVEERLYHVAVIR